MTARLPRSPLAITVASAAVAVAALGGATAAVAAPGQPGSPRYVGGAAGVGDPYFPLAGNGGIDVVHYSLDLDYTPPPPAPRWRVNWQGSQRSISKPPRTSTASTWTCVG